MSAYFSEILVHEIYSCVTSLGLNFKRIKEAFLVAGDRL